MKKSRKELLISSVSMLLVAILSLSVATYAWFTNNSITQASGINFRAQKNTNILLSLEKYEPEAVWNSELSLDIEKLDVKPVSTVDCVNWFTTYANNYNVAADETGGRSEIVQLTSDDYENYFIAKKFYIKSVAEDCIATYVINAEGYPDYDDWEQLTSLRVALVVEDDTKLRTVYSLDYYDNTGLINTDGDTDTIKVSDYPTGSIKLKADEPKEVTLYAWYEGEDPDCIDEYSGVASIIDVVFTKASSGGVIS